MNYSATYYKPTTTILDYHYHLNHYMDFCTVSLNSSSVLFVAGLDVKMDSIDDVTMYHIFISQWVGFPKVPYTGKFISCSSVITFDKNDKR